jgi:hypothetical protein
VAVYARGGESGTTYPIEANRRFRVTLSMSTSRNTPTKRLRAWAIEQGGRVHWREFHRHGNLIGCPGPAQNTLFAGRVPSMISDGEYREVTEAGTSEHAARA